MNDAPLVSVVTPAYNVGPWIGQAMDSALSQTEARFEYVVVDDGSTDDTAAIVRRSAASDPRIRLVSTRQRWLGRRAQRRARPSPRHRSVSFLDGDDRWHPQLLHHLLATLETAPPHIGAVFAHSRVMLASGRAVSLRWQPSGICDLDRLLVENCPPHGGSSLLIRRSCFDEVGDFDTALRSAIDFEMWLRIAPTSATPAFHGIRRWHVDMRLMRTGSISRDRTGRYRALETVLDRVRAADAALPPGSRVRAARRLRLPRRRTTRSATAGRQRPWPRAPPRCAATSGAWRCWRWHEAGPERPGPDAGGARRRSRGRVPRGCEGRRWLSSRWMGPPCRCAPSPYTVPRGSARSTAPRRCSRSRCRTATSRHGCS